MTKINNFGRMEIKSFIYTNRLIAKIIFFITRIILKIWKKKKDCGIMEADISSVFGLFCVVRTEAFLARVIIFRHSVTILFITRHYRYCWISLLIFIKTIKHRLWWLKDSASSGSVDWDSLVIGESYTHVVRFYQLQTGAQWVKVITSCLVHILVLIKDVYAESISHRSNSVNLHVWI